MSPQELQTPGTNQEQIDPTALTLSRAIRSAESTGYDQVVQEPNATTSFGAYGWNGDNFKNWAKDYGLDPNDTSETNQDHLAYLRIKDMLDQGKSQSEIAAIWNGAKMVNGKAVPINPDYVERVKSYYGQHAQNAQTNQNGFVSSPNTQASTSITPFSPQAPREQGLGERFQGRVEDIGSALSGKTSSNVFSGALQVGGAIGGGIGDIVGAGLELIPGVKNIENVIGQGIGQLAQTPAGQSVLKSVQDFAQKNPELAKNAEATFNIVTAIPILKGLGLAKDVALDGLSSALKNVAVNVADNEWSTIAKQSGKGAVRFMEDNPGIFKEAASKGMVPEIENVAGKNVYRPQNLIDDSWENIRNLNGEVQKILESAPRKLVPPTTQGFEQSGAKIVDDTINGFTDRNGRLVEGFPNSNFSREEIINTGRDLTPQNGRLWDKFELGQASPKDINELRMGLDNAVESVYSKMTAPPINKDIGKTLADSMRNYIQTNIPETQNLFSEMSKQFDFQKAFGYLENKALKPGFVSGVVKNAATGIGEAIGQGTGIPLAGTLMGRGFGGRIGRMLTGGVEGILRRTAPGAIRTSATEALPGLIKLGGGVAGQKLIR